MNKIVEDALAKGKALRQELDDKAKEAEKKHREQEMVEEANRKVELQIEVERYLSYIPELLAKAVSERKTSFSILSRGNDSTYRFSFNEMAALLEPKLKEMGLQFAHSTSTGWVQLSYDPDTGYDATYYHLDVIVPDESL
jgi:hypothetical protein